MRYSKLFLLILGATAVLLMLTAPVVSALDGGTDIFVPAAARAGTWVTDLYIFNPGKTTVNLSVSWLVRGQANPDPRTVDYSLAPGAQLVLEDVIAGAFGLDDVGGALRVVADRTVAVSSRIYNLRDGVTFGQGFEGVPRWKAVAAGGSADIMGLSNSTGFRSNLIVLDTSGSGSTVQLSLRDGSGQELASKDYALGAFEPMLFPVSTLPGAGCFDHATLHAEVTSGAAIVVASKVDNDAATGDPTTLAAWSGSTGDADGTYQIAIYESTGYASGGSLVIEDGEVTAINATYMNLEKGEDPADPDCSLSFLWGSPYAGTHSLDEYASGISFLSRPYVAGGTITWTVQLVVSNNHGLSGTVDAEGSGFTGFATGCNGTFPTLQLHGGKFD